MFTMLEKVKIMVELGHSPKLIDPNASEYNSILNAKFDVHEDIEAEVKEILEKIIALEEKEDGSMAHAGVRRVDDIEFFENGGATAQIKKQKSKYAKRIGLILDIPCFGGSSICIGVGIA